jgi:hypothetical protein
LTHTHTHTVVETGGCDVTDLLLFHKAQALQKAAGCLESNIKGKCHDRKMTTKETLQSVNKSLGTIVRL